MDHQEARWIALYEVRELAREGRYVVLDLETTSLEGEAIQWAVVAPDGETLGQGLIKPQGKVTEEARAIHHIQDEQLADAPPFDQVAPRIWHLLEGRAVVAYNADFESSRLYTSLCAVAGSWQEWTEEIRDRLSWLQYRCDWRCAMHWFAPVYGAWHPYFRSYTWQSLQTACAYFHLEIRPEELHDAAADARATALLVRKMAELAEAELPAGYHPAREEPCAGGCGQLLGPFAYDENPTWYCLECGLIAGINHLCPRCERAGKRTIVSHAALCEPVSPGTLCYSCQYEINMASGVWHLCQRCTCVVQAPVEVERFCASCQEARLREQRERRERRAALAHCRAARYEHMKALVLEGALEILEEQQTTAGGLTLARNPEILHSDYLTRGDVEPVLLPGFGGQATLVLGGQGTYGHFHIPYIQHWIVFADHRFVIVLVAYHSSGMYRIGRGEYACTAKGQFYRFYCRSEQRWEQVSWRRLGKFPERTHLAAVCREKAPIWARLPGATASRDRGGRAFA